MAEEKEEAPAGPTWNDPAKALGFATLICIDGGVDINDENLGKLLEAAGCKVDEKYSKVFCEAVTRGMDLKELVENFGKGGGGGGGGAAAAGGDAGAAAEAEPEEEEESEQSSSKAANNMFGDDSSSDESSS